MVAASMLSRAASVAFEWLYPIRFVAVAVCLAFFWRRYQTLNWRFGWLAPVTGLLVFLLWIGLDRVFGSHAAGAIESGMQGWSSTLRIGWLALRTCAAVTTVPVAEELAFRGFLTRRLISADFESVSFHALSARHILISSMAFGLMHGQRWVAGAIAGIIYAVLLRWKGRIGDAVIAHAVTNALLAAWVLALGKWELW
jgi:CAAX prenyl protease-like protein